MHAKIPRGLLVLGNKVQSRRDSESEEFDSLSSETAQITDWWNDARWKYTKRSYKGKNSNLLTL
jgi:hypothetical protein